MAVWKAKKIIFIGSQFSLLKILSKENETEVISSISFLETLAMRFLPDLIIADSLKAQDIMTIRKTDRFAFIPILITAEKFTMEEIEEIIPFPGILICNSIVSSQEVFIENLKKLMSRQKNLVNAKTGAIVKKAVHYIDLNLSRKFTRKDISDDIGVDQDYLTRIFHREMGIKLWDYLNILRLEEAKNLLVYTGLTIKEIAQKCGFSNSAYFCNCFQKYYGLTPGDIRNNR